MRHLQEQRSSGGAMRRLVSGTLAEAAGDGADCLFVYFILHSLDSYTLCLMGKSYDMLKCVRLIIKKYIEM